MSVVPSIIVLMITALIVFRREITAWPARGAKQRHGHRTMPSRRPRAPQLSGMTRRTYFAPRRIKTSTRAPAAAAKATPPIDANFEYSVYAATV
jgi:hypothetical protein